MATITVRNLDNRIRDRLKQKAAREGRSMEDYVRFILRQNIYNQNQKASTKAKSISNCFKGLDVNFDIPDREPLPNPISL